MKAHSILHEHVKANRPSLRSGTAPFAQEKSHNDASYCQYGYDAADDRSNHRYKLAMERELCKGATAICMIQAQVLKHCTSALLLPIHLHFVSWQVVTGERVSQSICTSSAPIIE